MSWPTTGLVFLFDAAQLTDANNTALTSIIDQSGAGNNLTVPAGTATVKTNAWNGNRALELNSTGSLALATTLDRQNMTILVCTKTTNPMINSVDSGSFYRGLWSNSAAGNPNTVTQSNSVPSIGAYDGSFKYAGSFCTDYDTILWRCGAAAVTVTDVAGDFTSSALASGTIPGLRFGDNALNQFPGVQRIGCIAVWNRQLSNAERDEAIAMAVASFPRTESLWTTGHRLVLAGTSIVAGYGCSTEANTLGRKLESTIPNTLNRAVASSDTGRWDTWAGRTDNAFTGSTGVNLLFMDAPTNDGGAAASRLTEWANWFAARKLAPPDIITVGSTMMPRSGSSVASDAFNALLLPEYDAWPAGGELAYKIKASSTQLNRLPDYLYDLNSNSVVTGDLTDTIHPDDVGTAAFAEGLRTLMAAIIVANTADSNGGGGEELTIASTTTVSIVSTAYTQVAPSGGGRIYVPPASGGGGVPAVRVIVAASQPSDSAVGERIDEVTGFRWEQITSNPVWLKTEAGSVSVVVSLPA